MNVLGPIGFAVIFIGQVALADRDLPSPRWVDREFFQQKLDPIQLEAACKERLPLLQAWVPDCVGPSGVDLHAACKKVGESLQLGSSGSDFRARAAARAFNQIEFCDQLHSILSKEPCYRKIFQSQLSGISNQDEKKRKESDLSIEKVRECSRLTATTHEEGIFPKCQSSDSKNNPLFSKSLRCLAKFSSLISSQNLYQGLYNDPEGKNIGTEKGKAPSGLSWEQREAQVLKNSNWLLVGKQNWAASSDPAAFSPARVSVLTCGRAYQLDAKELARLTKQGPAQMSLGNSSLLCQWSELAPEKKSKGLRYPEYSYACKDGRGFKPAEMRLEPVKDKKEEEVLKDAFEDVLRPLLEDAQAYSQLDFQRLHPLSDAKHEQRIDVVNRQTALKNSMLANYYNASQTSADNTFGWSSALGDCQEAFKSSALKSIKKRLDQALEILDKDFNKRAPSPDSKSEAGQI